MADDSFFDDDGDLDGDDETREISRPGAPSDSVRIIGAQEASAAYDEGDDEGPGRRPRRPPLPPPLPGGEQRPRVGGQMLGEREGTPSLSPSSSPSPYAPSPDAPSPKDAGDRPTGSVELPHWTEPPSGEVAAVTGRGREETTGAGAGTRARFRDTETDWEESDVSDLAAERGGVQPPDEPALDDDDAFDREVEERRRQVAEARHAGMAPPPTPRTGRFSAGVRRVGPEGAPAPGPETTGPPRPAVPQGPPPGGDRPRYGAPGRPPQGGPGPSPRGGGALEPGEPPPPPLGSGSVERDLPTAVLMGVAIGVAALVVFNLGRGPTAVLVSVVAAFAAAEMYAGLRVRGYRPAVPAGLAATAGLVLASYDRGFEGFTLVLGLAVMTTLVWFLIRAEDARPVVNAALTLLPVGYVGVLAAYGGLLLAFPNGVGMVLGVAIAVVAYDVCGYFVGSRVGTRRIAPTISPNKTSEGLAAGIIGAVLACLIFVRPIHPWDAGSALWLGVVVGIAAPLGDLVESMLKRDMNLKDFGTLIPGHGGVLDRFDALLFSLPPAFYLVRVLDLF